MFDLNEKVFYAELNQGKVTRRFVFPEEVSLVDKIKRLREIYPEINVFETGYGVISQIIIEDADPEQNSLEGIPSQANALYKVEFAYHPDIPNGQARYSEMLIEDIEMKFEELEDKEELQKPILEAPPSPKKISLTEQLKAQIKPTKEEPEAPVANMTLGEFLEKEKKKEKLPTLSEKLAEAKKKKEVKRKTSSKPAPSSFVITEESDRKIDEILRVVHSLDKSFRGENTELTGRDLARWFNEYSYENGTDKAWDYIASKCIDW